MHVIKYSKKVTSLYIAGELAAFSLKISDSKALKKSLKNICQIISAVYQITKASWWFAKYLKENCSERFSIGTAETKPKQIPENLINRDKIFVLLSYSRLLQCTES